MADRRTVLRRIRRTWIVIGLLIVIGLPAYMNFAFAPTGYPATVLQSDARVRVQNDAVALAFLPTGVSARVSALIFYPGCPVPAESYAPFARAIAERGHPVYVIHVPDRCAVRDAQRAELFRETEQVMAGAIRPWVLGGHSRGGAHASEFAAAHPHTLAGLLLEGTTHPRDVDLSGLRIPVTKLIGTRDGVAPEKKALANAHLLPPQTRWVRIEGGNHAQFGYYHFQLWDGRATISQAEQQRQAVAATVELLNTADAPLLEEFSTSGRMRRPEENSMNNDELNGKADKLKGRAKQAWGDVTNNERLHDEGVADEASGNVQEGFGKARRKVGEAIDDVADKIKD